MSAPNTSSSQTRGLAAIILAAGKSTRMKSDLPKVMHEICGRPMLAYVIDACREAGIGAFHVVVGFGKESVISAFSGEAGVKFVEQREQKGTAHAVSMCADSLKGFSGDCVVIAGDMPLVRAETLKSVLAAHRAAGAAASLATTTLADPTGYGRIIRDAACQFERIVEHRDCTPEQLALREVNPSYYCFDAAALFDALPKVKPNNAKGEYYITDVLSILRSAGRPVRATIPLPAEDATGINSRADLAEVSRLMQRRIAARWMDEGVTIVDPANTWIDSRSRIGAETIIRPFSYIDGHARIGRGCVVGPFAHIEDGAVIPDGAHAGPGTRSALDAAARRPGAGDVKRQVQVLRRPPAQAGLA